MTHDENWPPNLDIGYVYTFDKRFDFQEFHALISQRFDDPVPQWAFSITFTWFNILSDLVTNNFANIIILWAELGGSVKWDTFGNDVQLFEFVIMFYNFRELWSIRFIFSCIFTVKDFPVIGYVCEANQASLVTLNDCLRDITPP